MTIKRTKSQSLQNPLTRTELQPLKGSLGGLGRANWEFVRHDWWISSHGRFNSPPGPDEEPDWQGAKTPKSDRAEKLCFFRSAICQKKKKHYSRIESHPSQEIQRESFTRGDLICHRRFIIHQRTWTHNKPLRILKREFGGINVATFISSSRSWKTDGIREDIYSLCR